MVLTSATPLPLLIATPDTDMKHGDGVLQLYRTGASFSAIDATIKAWFHDEMLGRTFKLRTGRHFRHAACVRTMALAYAVPRGFRRDAVDEEVGQTVTVLYFSRLMGAEMQCPLLCVYDGPRGALVLYLPKVMKEERAVVPGEGWDEVHGDAWDHVGWEGCLRKLQVEGLVASDPMYEYECAAPGWAKPFMVRCVYAAVAKELVKVREVVVERARGMRVDKAVELATAMTRDTEEG